MLGFVEERLYYPFAVVSYDGFTHTCIFEGRNTDSGGHCQLSNPEEYVAEIDFNQNHI